jgi:hypothetical protein
MLADHLRLSISSVMAAVPTIDDGGGIGLVIKRLERFGGFDRRQIVSAVGGSKAATWLRS